MFWCLREPCEQNLFVWLLNSTWSWSLGFFCTAVELEKELFPEPFPQENELFCSFSQDIPKLWECGLSLRPDLTCAPRSVPIQVLLSRQMTMWRRQRMRRRVSAFLKKKLWQGS